MKKIKRIEPKSLAKILGAVYAILGLILGAIFSLISLATAASGHLSGLFGVAAIVLLPLLYGVLGIVFGYLIALLYNVVAARVGGIEFEVE